MLTTAAMSSKRPSQKSTGLYFWGLIFTPHDGSGVQVIIASLPGRKSRLRRGDHPRSHGKPQSRDSSDLLPQPVIPTSQCRTEAQRPLLGQELGVVRSLGPAPDPGLDTLQNPPSPQAIASSRSPAKWAQLPRLLGGKL